jgi:hypothetical protein
MNNVPRRRAFQPAQNAASGAAVSHQKPRLRPQYPPPPPNSSTKITTIKISSIRLLRGPNNHPSDWMGRFFSGASLSGGISGTFRSGSTSGTGGIISGSCFLGSPFIASPFLFDGEQLLGNAKRSLSKRSQTECSAEEKQTAPGMIRRRNRSQVALGRFLWFQCALPVPNDALGDTGAVCVRTFCSKNN